ncbi:MAG: hypothetical protein U5K74_04920 [Gemmatimonadaceae bacterium]|nr:hypothetical protein [Gemmatimonadaceae bacterium]
MERRVTPDVAAALWTPLVEHGSRWCARNIHADVGWLDVDGVRWPIAVTRTLPRNCYVVSATGQYLDYALEETRRLPAGVVRRGSVLGLRCLAPALRRLDPIVVLDALPVSTVLHQRRTPDEWRHAVDTARAQFRGAPIVIRSLDAVHTPELLDHALTLGMSLLTSRLVFHQDPRHDAFWSIRNVRNDIRLERESPMLSRTLHPADATDIAALYWQLYGEKHSTLNPDFSPSWLAYGMAAGALTGEGLVHDGRLVAAYLSYTVNDVMTNPVFGYDTTFPQALGLYRRLSLLTMQCARRRALRIHASSGAPGFKASRGGVATVEYHAVDLRTVRGTQLAAWQLTRRIAAMIGPRMLAHATLCRWRRPADTGTL